MTQGFSDPEAAGELRLTTDLELESRIGAAMDFLEEIPTQTQSGVTIDKFVSDMLPTSALRSLALSHYPGLSSSRQDVKETKVGTQLYVFPRYNQPQAAKILYVHGVAKLKTGLAISGGLAEAGQLLETSRQLLRPFVAREPGYRLMGRGHLIVNSQRWDVREVGYGQYDHLRIVFAKTLSAIGRLGIAEGDAAGNTRLEEAHSHFIVCSDRLGEVRNALYSYMAEQSRGGDSRPQRTRLLQCLAVAVRQKQALGALRLATSMARYVTSQERAQLALTDWRAV